MPIVLTLEESVSPGLCRKSFKYLVQRPTFQSATLQFSNLLTWFFPPIINGSYLTSWYHRSMHVLINLNTSRIASNRLRKHYLNAQNPGSSAFPLGPPPGLCPGPAGDLRRSPDPLPNFVPPTSNPGYAPGYVLRQIAIKWHYQSNQPTTQEQERTLTI